MNDYGEVFAISQAYDSLSEIIKKLAEDGLPEHKELNKRLETLGELLSKHIFDIIKKINDAKPEEKEDKIVEVEKIIPKDDYKYFENVAKKDYKECWEKLEHPTRTFIVTALYMDNLINSEQFDFSPIVMELGKSVENEMKEKVYLPFIIENSKLPLKAEPTSKKGIWVAVNRYQSNKGYYLPFKATFSTLNKPTIYEDSYYYDLHTELQGFGWNMDIITDVTFIQEGLDYSDNFRNSAAHSDAFTNDKVSLCELSTNKILNTLISAYPKTK